MSYFIYSTTAKVTKAAAKRINSRIKAIDDTASFVGPLKIPGNRTTGWIQRPNDGCNDYNDQASANRRMAEIAREELEGEKSK